MGYQRNPQPASLDRSGVRCAVIQAFAAIDTSTPSDPFGIDHDCINPAGHFSIRSAGDLVCAHCEKVFWR